ncbi:MAG TPA: VOC family protein [Bryobacteraceae bacterium]|jgi:catechol 2,3-dioxygenase-like lactoylglutathione lyase family enzyme|nr:VOC family protein [Bryobacteraceae bacterium]
MPAVASLLETALYTSDVERSASFYRKLFGFPEILSDGARLIVLALPGNSVLLLFRKGASTEPMSFPGGMIPPHDGEGTTHLAFNAGPGGLAAWDAALAAEKIEIESRVHWPRGGISIYFRDPDGHLLEIVEGNIWGLETGGDTASPL